MAGGGSQPAKSTAEAGESDACLEQVGGGLLDLGPDILGGISVGFIIRFRDMANEAVHWEGVGRIPQQGGPRDDR